MISITNVSADMTNSDVAAAADVLDGERDELEERIRVAITTSAV